MLKAMIILAGCVLWVITATAQDQRYTAKETQDIVRSHMDDVRKGGGGTWPFLDENSKFDRKTVTSQVIPYLHDSHEDVRWFAATKLGQFGDRDAVMPLAHTLDDNDWNVRVAACRALCDIAVRELLPHKEDLRPCLLRLARRVDSGGCELAIGLLGDLAGVAAVSDIKEMRRFLATPANVTGKTPKRIASLDDRCMLVLAKLGDADAQKEISGLLRSENVTDRVRAIAHVKRVGRAIGAELLPLLDDRRDAIKAGTSAHSWMLRVSDVTLEALVRIYELKPSFTMSSMLSFCRPFSDAQIAEIKKLVEAELAKTR